MASASTTYCPSLTSSLSSTSTLLDEEHVSSYFSDDSDISDSDDYDSDAVDDDLDTPLALAHQAETKSAYISDDIFLDDMDVNKG